MKPRWILLVAGAAGVITAASLYWMYAPLLSQELPSWWGWRAAYCRGWIQAEKDVWNQHSAYSFRSFRVQGIQEYALATQELADPLVPASSSKDASYVWGYNDRMEKTLRKSLGKEFPETFVRAYLDKGWIDRSSERPQFCPVHKRQMRLAIIPREIAWPLTMPHPSFPRDVAAQRSFPFPDTTYREDASFLLTPAFVKTWVCDECGRAEAEWLAAHPPLRQPMSSAAPETSP